MLKIAAHQLEVDPSDLEIRDGMITVRGMPLDEDVIAGGRLQTPEAAAEHRRTRGRPVRRDSLVGQHRARPAEGWSRA